MMSPEDRERWEQIRRKGPVCFILLYGTFLIGGGFAVGALLAAYRQGTLTWRVGLGGLVIWLTAGSVFSWSLWLLKERENRRSQR